MTTVPPFIPELGNMLAGLDWDISLPESVAFENEISQRPIEDPNTSFVRDHNTQKPIQITFALAVSTTPAAIKGADGAERISAFYDKLIALRNRQSVSVDSFIEVYTGIRRFPNMAFRGIFQERSEGGPNTALFIIEMEEFRSATRPKLTSLNYLLNASEGIVSNNNAPLTTESDRMVVEATSYIKQFRRVELTPEKLAILTF